MSKFRIALGVVCILNAFLSFLTYAAGGFEDVSLMNSGLLWLVLLSLQGEED